ncbi:MAG: CBS domain-containing protein, partial [Pseudonocardiaceae bacterium]
MNRTQHIMGSRNRPEGHIDKGSVASSALRSPRSMLVALFVTNAEDAMGQLTVKDVMTTAVLKVRPTTPFKEVVRVMADHHVSALPVVDSDDQLVGVVSEADLLPKQELHGQRPAHRWP